MKLFSLVVCLLVFTSSVTASDTSVHPTDKTTQDGPTIEITDKYDEVVLGMTESKVYMIISDQLKEQMNKDLERAYINDLQSFNDSNGLFIIGTYQPLLDTKIEYHRNDIHDIYLKDGTIHFEYNTLHSVLFSDIYSSNGKNALSNFSKKDLENFVKHFKNS